MKSRFLDKIIPPAGRHRSLGPSLKSGKGIKIEKTVAIHRPVHEIYSFWRHLENLPRFMPHLVSVSQGSDGTSHWVMRSDHGPKLEWTARIIEERADEMISWQSLPDADVHNAGSVWFTPTDGGQATVVKISMKYSLPGGILGATVVKVLGASAEKSMADDLSRLKQLLETGV